MRLSHVKMSQSDTCRSREKTDYILIPSFDLSKTRRKQNLLNATGIASYTYQECVTYFIYLGVVISFISALASHIKV